MSTQNVAAFGPVTCIALHLEFRQSEYIPLKLCEIPVVSLLKLKIPVLTVISLQALQVFPSDSGKISKTASTRSQASKVDITR
jgi:hypothetical protein